MKDKCDKCQSDILMGECSCGEWYEPGHHPEIMKTLEKAIIDFNASDKDISSGDHHTGSCFVFFKGDYAKVQMVVSFIEGIEKIIKAHPDHKDGMKINFVNDQSK